MLPSESQSVIRKILRSRTRSGCSTFLFKTIDSQFRLYCCTTKEVLSYHAGLFLIQRKMLSTTLARASMWSRLKSVPSEHPFAFGVFVSGVKTSFSDLLVQKVVERREQVDWKRNFAFATFGFIYLGGVQYAIYVPLFGRLFPRTASFVAKPFREKLKDTRGILGTMAQVFLDQAVHHPFMYFPAFYATVRKRHGSAV